MVGRETTGMGKQFPWDCLEQAAQRGCGSPSLEIFRAHLDTALCNVLRGPCLSREVGWDDTQCSLATRTTLGFCAGGWILCPGAAAEALSCWMQLC